MATVRQLRPKLGGPLYSFIRLSKDGYDESVFTDLQATGVIDRSYLITQISNNRFAGPFNNAEADRVCELINIRVNELKRKPV